MQYATNNMLFTFHIENFRDKAIITSGILSWCISILFVLFAMSNQICSNEFFFSCLIHFPRSSIDLCHGSLRGFSFFISRDFSNWTISNKQSPLKANVRPAHMRWCVPIDIYLRSMWITSSIEQSFLWRLYWHWDGRDKNPYWRHRNDVCALQQQPNQGIYQDSFYWFRIYLSLINCIA